MATKHLRRRTRPFWVDEQLDEYGVADPERTYVVASVGRSGSTLLAAAFRVSGRFGVPFEYFSQESIAHLARRLGVLPLTARGQLRQLQLHLRAERQRVPVTELSPAILADYVGELRRIRTTPNGVFGVKILDSQFGDLREGIGVDLLDQVQPRRIVFLTRRDHLRQPVSLYRAQQSGVWNTRVLREPTPLPPFERTAIEALIETIEAGEALWEEALRGFSAEVHEVTYEDLDADYEGVVTCCFAFLGELDAPVPPRHNVRMADAITEDWVARLRATPGS
jgi:trehalose 2-sulfotransferase